jgi:demethylmenaquinone methyltransferase / 2-methoxy-6-polyprenyl-1,4-benzoquinol methylase
MVPRGGSGEMFDRIAGRYDLVNRLLSLGIDQRWRARTVEALALEEGARVLDLATGTADLALQIAQRHPQVNVVGLDPSQGMLEVGRRKVERAALQERIELRFGHAEALPFESASFDGVCIAFGIRNVPDRETALKEMKRVTRYGGRIAILELSEPKGVLGPIARFHVHTLVPWIGALLSGKREYRYLEQSIAAFPSPTEFARSMNDCGLQVINVAPLSFGVCHLFVATPRGAA